MILPSLIITEVLSNNGSRISDQVKMLQFILSQKERHNTHRFIFPLFVSSSNYKARLFPYQIHLWINKGWLLKNTK